MFIHVTGTGSCLPEKVVTNDELSTRLDTTDEWIFSHTGIHSRHIAAPDECTSDLAVSAARRALEDSGITPDQLGMIIVASSSSDYLGFPTVSCLVQEALGAKQAGVLDVQAACTGFIYAMQVARGLMQFDPRPALVIGAETMSRVVDWSDRNTCILFGDGAGAAVLESSEIPGGIQDAILKGDGTGSSLIFRTGGVKTVQAEQGKLPFLRMNGRAVFNFAVKIFDEVLSALVARSKIVLNDLAQIIPHQANARIIEATARRMKMPLSSFFMNMETTGNTSAASIPIALDVLNRAGKLKAGDLLAAVGFGAGLTYGGLLMQWTKPLRHA